MEITVTILLEERRFNAGAALYSALLDDHTIRCVLQAEVDDVEAGRSYTLCGDWKDRGRWGKQFQANSFIEATPLSRRAVLYYLGKLPGIGPKTAERICDHYGEPTLERLVADPSFLASLPRFNPTKARGLAATIQGDMEMITSKMELQAYLQGNGFPHKLADKLYNKHGVQAMDFLRRNPYMLLAYDGCGFLRVDAFALKNGFPPLRLKRQTLFLLYFMEGEGDVWFPLHQLKAALVKQFGADARWNKALRLLRRAKRIVCRQDEDTLMSEPFIAPTQDVEIEQTIAEEVRRCCHEPNTPVPMDLSSLTESQSAALQTATRYRLGCFVGGPGTGKTYSVARYIQGVVQTYGADSILVVAPTGKAVVRSREMLQSIQVSCASATLHSYLYGKASADYPFIVCDEASMIDAELMRDFLVKSPFSSILLVGDDGQLLPVGKGRPFADFLASGVVPVGRLTQTMRNSGRIVQVCHQIRQDVPWECSPALNLDAGENLKMITTTDLLGAVKQIATRWRGQLDPIRDIQVIVGVNKGPVGRETVNTELQRFLNPGSDMGKYRVNDPVICLKNGTYRDTQGDENVYLSNGEIGYCVETNPHILVDFGMGKVVQISEKQLTFDLAYAVTCHKMQGSETPVAIVLLDTSYPARMVCTREWLYTAISRAKKACYLVGSQQTAKDYCRKLGNVRRTQLAEAIRGET